MPQRHARVRSPIALDRLRNRVRAIPDPDHGSGSASERRWLENMSELRGQLLTREPHDFLRWDVIRRTMFVGSSRYVRRELDALRDDPGWNSRWRQAIIENRAGDPPGFPRYRASSGNLIHHAYHLHQYEHACGTRVSDIACVVEFGGGYGSMCRLIHRLGFRGRYIIIDLPVFLALQAFYLDETGITANADIRQFEDPGEVMPAMGPGKTMFIATWSYSEVPPPVRSRIAPVMAACTHLLVGFQDRFEDLVNQDLEAEIRRTCGPDRAWHAMPIPHLPGNRYLFAAPAR